MELCKKIAASCLFISAQSPGNLVFDCKSIGKTRDLHGERLNKMTGLPGAHIVGEHLCLPGYGEDHPTLEIFSYDDNPAQ